MTTTQTGLEVYLHINRKTYETKVEVPQSFENNIERFCTFDDKIPKWNYIVKVP